MTLDLAALGRRWFEEVWNQRRNETIDELMHQEGRGHLEGREVRGPENFKAASAELLRAFPDLRVTVEDAIAQGNQVVVRWNATATHTGAALGLTPTGRSVAVRGMT
jgi:predicted ester cyclase